MQEKDHKIYIYPEGMGFRHSFEYPFKDGQKEIMLTAVQLHELLSVSDDKIYEYMKALYDKN